MKSEVSCFNCRSFIDYVRARHPENLHLLWEPLAGMLPADEDPEVFLSDSDNWISIDMCRDIIEQTKKAALDENAIYKAGFESVRQKKLGYVEKILVRGLFTPKHAIRKAQKINDRFNRTKRIQIIEASNTHALLRLHWFKDPALTSDFCQMNKGIYQAMSTVWDLPPARLKENVCFFEGGPYCEYELWWEKKSLWKLFLRRRKVKKEVLASLLKEMERDKDLIRFKYEQVSALNTELERKVAYLMSLQEASQAVVSVLDEQSLIQTILNLLTSVIGFDRAIIFLVDEKQEKLRFAQAAGAMGDSLKYLKDYEIPLDRMSNILVRVASTGSPKFVKDVASSNLRQENVILSLFRPKNFAASPLIARNKVIGVLAGELPSDTADMSESDLSLLMTFSNHIAVAIENARLYRDLESSFLATLQSQKMEAMGTLAGGIAHDFNNILQAILGHIELLLDDFGKQRPLYNRLKQVETAAEQASGLTKQLLTFSRKGERKPRPVRLNEEIQKVGSLLTSTIPKTIGIDFELDPSLNIISADPIQVNQVLMNLAINARDAMPYGGKLVMGTKNVTLDQDSCRAYAGLNPGEYVMLWVSDTGHGIEKDVLDHIFDPFFTTKDPGKGTGLGLSTAYGILQTHQGHINCESQPGVGTTFRAYFRTLDKARQELPGERDEDSVLMQGTETILLVDDEASTRGYGRELLGRFGYKVLVAENGEEGVEVFVRHKDHIDLVVLDLIMPGMGGKGCLDEMLKHDPQVSVLITTGYADSDIVREALGAGAKALIKKPFRAEKMVNLIRSTLDEKRKSTEITSHKRGPGLRVVGSE